MLLRNEPFRHLVIDGLWDDALLNSLLAEFPDPAADGWIRYQDKAFEVKLEGPEDIWGPAAHAMFAAMTSQGPALADLFGLPELKLRSEGGGYHHIEPGGRLAVHADFNRSEDGLFRRLNIIVYLNRGWVAADGGALQLWNRREVAKEILPVFNRTVVFETSDTSFHGHPEPLPGPRPRRSFAAYFFSADPPEHYSGDHSTVWHAGPAE
jgi:2OG-Fe(II) oxygenase superfamily